MNKAGLVLTTIYDPECLEGYRDNLERYDHLKQVEVFVVTDNKTPQATWARCESLRERWLDIHCIGTVEAAEFIQKIGLKSEMFPQNSDSRRNIGYLMALASECDFIISIDDDNHCRVGNDYFADHEVCLMSGSEALGSNSGWFNSCDCLDTSEYVYQRGFPYYIRTFPQERVTGKKGKFEIHANMGLWTGDPDIDALSWIVTPTQSRKMFSESLILDRKTWSPINSQNTSVRAEAMPAYFFIPMDGTIMGHKIGHDGDIFQGYFFQKCMKHLSGHLRIGTPVVDHRRNSHNYFYDAEQEWYCIRLLEEMLPWLTEECKLEGKDYCAAYESLALQIEEWVRSERKSYIVSGSAGYLLRISRLMKEWARACRLIGMRKVEA